MFELDLIRFVYQFIHLFVKVISLFDLEIFFSIYVKFFRVVLEFF